MRDWKLLAGAGATAGVLGVALVASGASAAKTLYTSALYGNIPNVTVRGVAAGGAPWVVRGTVTVTTTSIVIKGSDLVVPPGYMATDKPVAKSLVGTTVGIPAVGAELSCGQGTTLLTGTAPLSKKGAFQIDSTVKVPTACTDPIVLVGPVKGGKMVAWFASSNFLEYGLPGKSTVGWGGAAGGGKKSSWA